jgi:hypothetical protein
MRVTGSALLCSLLLALSPVRSDDAAKEKAARAWARRVAKDFLDGVLDAHGDMAQASSHVIGLFSPELANAILARQDAPFFFFDWVNGGHSSARITSEEAAPDGGEVIFSGVLEGEQQADFVIRVAKEAGHGKWSIRYLRAKIRYPAKKR